VPASGPTYNPNSLNPLYQFLFGVRFFFSGIRLLLRHPSLLGLAAIPVLLTVIVVFGLAFFAASQVRPWLGNESPGLRLAFQAAVFVLALFVGYLIYLPLARIFLAPISELLSRRAWALSANGSVERIEIGVGRAVWEGMKLVALQLLVTVFAVVIGFIFPPVGVPLGVFVTLCVSGIDFLDVPLSLRGLPLKRKLGVLWRNKAVALGFSAAVYLLLLVPILNLLALPIGVVGATALVSRLDWQD
jgi:CysZ protein